MDATLIQLGQLLLRAVPTLILLLILHLYLKAMFFKPLQLVLQKRRDATEGAREAADASLKQASDKAAEYEAKLQEARAEIYKEQEEMRKRWLEEQTRHLEETRQQTHELIHNAKLQLDRDVEVAKSDLAVSSETLANQIAQSLLRRAS